MVSTPNPDFLPPMQENDFLPPISRLTNLSGLCIVGVVGIAVALAAVTQYKVTVKGQAAIRPTGELRLVQAATEGAVMQVLVAENQPIRKGQVIATIDDTHLQTQKRQLQSMIQQAQLQLLQINAQIRSLDSQIVAETNRMNRASASATAELSRTQRNYRDRQITTVAEVEEAEANLRSAKAALSAARVRRERYLPVAVAGAISQDRLEEAQLEVEQQEQAVEVAAARRQRVAAALQPSQAEVTIASERIAQEQASGESTLAALRREKEALIQQQIQTQAQLKRDSQELQQVKSDLSKTIITATADGVISTLNLRNSGQMVQPGQEIAQIVPDDARLVIKALVAAQDIGKVKAGQAVQLRVSACPYPDYGILQGRVSAISPDATAMSGGEGLSASRAVQNRVAANAFFYEVTIDPASLALTQGKKHCSVQLGMEGRVDIISKEETFLPFLLRKARLIVDL